MPRLVGMLMVLLAAAPVAAQPHPAARTARATRLIARGEALLQSGDRGSAIAFFRDAIQADPTSARAYLRLGQAYRSRGSLRDARTVLEAGIMRAPDDASLWLELAQTRIEEGDPDDAARAIRSLLARDPQNARAMQLRADLARERGAWSEALTAYRALLASDTLDAAQREQARRYERALRLLARPLDPVSASRACEGSPLRRLLARCP